MSVVAASTAQLLPSTTTVPATAVVDRSVLVVVNQYISICAAVVAIKVVVTRHAANSTRGRRGTRASVSSFTLLHT